MLVRTGVDNASSVSKKPKLANGQVLRDYERRNLIW